MDWSHCTRLDQERFTPGMQPQGAVPVPRLGAESEYQSGKLAQLVRSPQAPDGYILRLPSDDAIVMRGVTWGRPDTLFTPAYWRAQAWFSELRGASGTSHALGDTLAEETAACLLGGYGIPAEIGLAAFQRVRAQGLLYGGVPSADACYAVLSEPLLISGREVRYRFARQKSIYLSEVLAALHREQPPTGSDTAFRDWLAALPGIGMKTASWITRNWLNSDMVAIIDIHVHRAGIIAGFFRRSHKLPAGYRAMEQLFLRFASSIHVRPALLDALVWRDMRTAGALARALVH